MKRRRSGTSSRRLARVLFFLPVLTVILGTQPAYASSVTYSGLATGNVASPFDSGGVTATSTGTMSIQNGQGLGLLPFVLLGPAIDNSGSIEFTFDAGAATGVSFDANFAFNSTGNSALATFLVQGFDSGGASLGTQSVDVFDSFPNYGISSLFGNAPLSAFIIEGNGNNAGVDVASVTYTTAAPEPGTIATILGGFAALAFVRYRRFR